VQRGKGYVIFWESYGLWNSNCDSTLRQVQPANPQTRRYSYTSAPKHLALPMGRLTL